MHLKCYFYLHLKIKGVLPEFNSLADQLTTGMCVALEIRQENSVQAFRKFVGPHDPEIAKVVRPDSLRAKFGTDRVKNAIHCTDLDEDGVLEVNYSFYVPSTTDIFTSK